MSDATLFGLRVREIPQSMTRRPVLQISPSFPYCSEAFRRDWNAWALERFGTYEVAFMFNGNFLASPKQIAILKTAAREWIP